MKDKVSKPIRILTIAQDLNHNHLGGAESHHVEVINRLSETNKYLFTVVVGRNGKISTNFHKSVSVVVVNYPKIINLNSFLYIPFALFVSIGLASRRKFDIVWAKQVFPMAFIAGILNKVFKTPVYITSQNPLAYKEELVVTGNIPKALSLIVFPIIHNLNKWSLRQAQVVAGISKFSTKESVKLGAKKVVTIPNGVDLKKYYNKPRKPKKTLTIISTSSFIPRNGVDTLIKSLKFIKTKNFVLLLTSSGPLLKLIKREIVKNNLQTKVKLLGKVDHNQIPDLLRSADMFARPSRAEGLGTSFLEAMACGVPVIGTRVGGIPDFLIHGQTGLFAKPDNPKSVADQINLLDSDKKLQKKISKNSAELIKREYSWESIAKKVDQQFQEIIHNVDK